MSDLKPPPNSNPNGGTEWKKLRMSTPSKIHKGFYMSQSEWADKIGASVRAVGSWEQDPDKVPYKFFQERMRKMAGAGKRKTR